MRQIFRQIAATIARALRALATGALVATWEAGRWVWRAARALSGAPEPEPELAAELADEVIPAQALSPAAASPDAEWGAAALAHLCGEPGAEGVLDEAAVAYLDGLDAAQRGTLAQYPSSMIGQHLRAVRTLSSLPPAPTLADWRAAQAQAAADSAQAAHRRLTAREEADAIREEVFQDLLGEDYEPLAA